MIYCGVNEGSTSESNRWLDQQGKWFEVTPIVAPWMEIAWREYDSWSNNGWTEKNGDGLKRAQEYVDISNAGFSPKNEAWCACFVDWVLKKTNEVKLTNYSTVEEYPASSQNYAEKNRYPKSKIIKPSMNEPAYGLITILHSSGWSGHAGFIVNFKLENSKYYAYLLGGNQNDKLCVQEFEIYESNKSIKFKTAKGTIYTLKGYVYPEEYDLDNMSEMTYQYTNREYIIESAISTR